MAFTKFPLSCFLQKRQKASQSCGPETSQMPGTLSGTSEQGYVV